MSEWAFAEAGRLEMLAALRDKESCRKEKVFRSVQEVLDHYIPQEKTGREAIDEITTEIQLIFAKTIDELVRATTAAERERIGRILVERGYWTEEMSEEVLAAIREETENE